MALWGYTTDELDRSFAHAGGSGIGLWAAGGAEAFPRIHLGEAQSSSGELWLSYFTAPSDTEITTLGICTGQAGGTGVTLCRMGLLLASADDSLTLVARAASDITVATGAYATYTRALSATGGYPTSYTLQRGVRYAFGFLQVCSGAATWCRIAGAVNDATPPIMCRKITGQADIATSYAVGSLTSHYNTFYQFGV